MDLGEWVLAARKLKGWTQTQLGDAMGVTKGNVSAWENERHEPSFSQVMKLSELTGAQIETRGNVRAAEIDAHRVPLLDYVQAGLMTEATGPGLADDASEFLLTTLAVSSGAFALRIKGNSMEPEFHEGDVVIIDPTEVPLPGDFVVAKNGDHEATFKKYRPRGVSDGKEVFELVPLNEDYAPMRSDQQHIEIIGTMVEHRKYRRR